MIDQIKTNLNACCHGGGTSFDFGSLPDRSLLQDQLLQFGRRGDEANITALFDDAPDPPVHVVLLEDVEEVADVKGDG